MPTPIQRIPTYDPFARNPNEALIEHYVLERFQEKFTERVEGATFECSVNFYSEYIDVKLFTTVASLVPDLEDFAYDVQRELRKQGFGAIITVHTFTR